MHDEPDTYYAILADECKDLSKRELVAVCVRYLHNGTLKERAVGFVEMDNMTAEAISAKVLEVLESLQLDLGLCVRFGFDGEQRRATCDTEEDISPHFICAL